MTTTTIYVVMVMAMVMLTVYLYLGAHSQGTQNVSQQAAVVVQ